MHYHSQVDSIWDWQRQARLNRFSNGNPLGSKINETRFINEDDQALLVLGSSDGTLKIYRNYESSKEIEIVTAFRALTDLIPSNKNAGLVFDWQQGQGKALVAGDVKVIRVWNAATEICTNASLSGIETRIAANNSTGHTRPVGLMYHVSHVRSGCRQRFCRRLRGRSCARL